MASHVIGGVLPGRLNVGKCRADQTALSRPQRAVRRNLVIISPALRTQ